MRIITTLSRIGWCRLVGWLADPPVSLALAPLVSLYLMQIMLGWTISLPALCSCYLGLLGRHVLETQPALNKYLSSAGMPMHTGGWGHSSVQYNACYCGAGIMAYIYLIHINSRPCQPPQWPYPAKHCTHRTVWPINTQSTLLTLTQSPPCLTFRYLIVHLLCYRWLSVCQVPTWLSLCYPFGQVCKCQVPQVNQLTTQHWCFSLQKYSTRWLHPQIRGWVNKQVIWRREDRLTNRLIESIGLHQNCPFLKFIT